MLRDDWECYAFRVEENRTINAKNAVANLLKSIPRQVILRQSKKIVWKCKKHGLGFRAIERVTGVNHNTVIRWVRKSAIALPDTPEMDEIPEITEIDELQTYIGQKKQAGGCGQQLTIFYLEF